MEALVALALDVTLIPNPGAACSSHARPTTPSPNNPQSVHAVPTSCALRPHEPRSAVPRLSWRRAVQSLDRRRFAGIGGTESFFENLLAAAWKDTRECQRQSEHRRQDSGKAAADPGPYTCGPKPLTVIRDAHSRILWPWSERIGSRYQARPASIRRSSITPSNQRIPIRAGSAVLSVDGEAGRGGPGASDRRTRSRRDRAGEPCDPRPVSFPVCAPTGFSRPRTPSRPTATASETGGPASVRGRVAQVRE